MKYSKAIAAIVSALVAVLVAFNITIDKELEGAIIVVVTGLATLLAPRNEY